MKRALLTLSTALTLCGGLSGCFPLIAGGIAGGTAMLVTDRRTSGAYVEDQGIELKASSQLGKQFPDAHININSFNRTVLMTGEIPAESARQPAEMLVRALPGVVRVEDYMVVAPPSTFSERNNDTWITGKVRSRLLGGEGYSSQAIKVITERGVVYMMGLVTRAEGDAAARVVSQTTGVVKVVTLFEYLNAVPATGASVAPAGTSVPVATSQPVKP